MYSVDTGDRVVFGGKKYWVSWVGFTFPTTWYILVVDKNDVGLMRDSLERKYPILGDDSHMWLIAIDDEIEVV